MSFAGAYRFSLTLGSLSASDMVCVSVRSSLDNAGNWVLDSGADLHEDFHQIIFTGARNSLMTHDPGVSAKTLEDQAHLQVKETISQSKRLESGKENKRNTDNW